MMKSNPKIRPPVIVKVPLEPEDYRALLNLAKRSNHTLESVIISACRFAIQQLKDKEL